MNTFLDNTARRIPEGIRKQIIEQKMIDSANEYSDVKGTPMEYLFDVHAEFLDPSGEYQNFDCPKCRAHVLQVFRKLKPYM